MSKKILKRFKSIIFTLGILVWVIFLITDYYKDINIKAEINRYLKDEKYEEVIKFVDSTIKKESNMEELYAYKGLALIKLGKNEEAITTLKKSIEIGHKDEDVYNNLSWACYNIKRYEEALSYGKEAYDINPYNDIILINIGNAQLALNQYEEAQVSYTNALKIDNESVNAIYGRGVVYFETDKYEEAIEDFTAYLGFFPNDEDALYYLGQVYINSGDNQKAIDIFDKALDLNYEYPYIYIAKGQALDGLKLYKESLETYRLAIKKDPKYLDAYINIGASFYYQGKYKDAIGEIQKAIDIAPMDSTAYVWMAKVNIGLKEYGNAIELCNKAIVLNKQDTFAYNIKSNAQYFLEDYNEALETINVAIEIDKQYDDAYVSKASILYRQNNLEYGIKFLDEAIKLFPNNRDLLWYMGDMQSASSKHEEALKYYQQVLAFNESNTEANMNLAWEYFYIQDYNKSQDYLSISEKIEKTGEMDTLKELLKEAKLPEGQRIVNFIRENYLYLNKVNNFDKKAKEISSKQDLDIIDINKFLKSVIVPEDRFSYIVYGKGYDELNQEEIDLHVTSKALNEEISYINIPGFVEQTDTEFIEIVDKINKPEEKNLLIDLRDNLGGSIASANKILDFLIGKTVTCSLVDRNREAYNYLSDKNLVKFKKIFILVNENSASSSEILALSLKRNLDNVTIVGKPTFGKGVGQLTFENKKDKYAIFITNFYWNVKNENITGKKITPDIIVKGSSEDAYFNDINKIIGK